jgi:hypothetical protein
MMGSADRRGIGAPANRGTNRRFAMTRRRPFHSPLPGILDGLRRIISPTVAIETHPPPWSRHLQRAAVVQDVRRCDDHRSGLAR